MDMLGRHGWLKHFLSKAALINLWEQSDGNRTKPLPTGCATAGSLPKPWTPLPPNTPPRVRSLPTAMSNEEWPCHWATRRLSILCRLSAGSVSALQARTHIKSAPLLIKHTSSCATLFLFKWPSTQGHPGAQPEQESKNWVKL